MNNNPIGFFDSGIGGLTTLEETIKILPNENYIFLGDNLNNPYGDKTDEKILLLTEKGVNFLLNKGCKLIVLACNTATNVAIDFLRQKYSIPIVGTEPAIKLVTKEKINGKVLVMATKGTINSKRFKTINEKYGNENVLILPCPSLAELIESNNQIEIDNYLKEKLKEYKDINTIVLGCTHYIHIKDNIRKLFPNINFIDGNKGIARQTKKILTEKKLLNISNKRGKIEKIFTLDNS